MNYLMGYLGALMIGLLSRSTSATPPNYARIYDTVVRELPALCLSASRGPGQSSAALAAELTKLSAKDDGCRASRFFNIVKALAYRQGLDPFGLTVPCNGFCNGHAAPITAGRCRYVLVVMDAPDLAGPGGPWTETLILFSSDGEVLDQITSTIHVRWEESQETEVLDKPERDSAELVIWAKDYGDEYPLWHRITYGGKDYTFHSKGRQDAQRKDGLCRLKIQDGKFVCLFPKLVQPDPEK